jgi:hypothetical protein
VNADGQGIEHLLGALSDDAPPPRSLPLAHLTFARWFQSIVGRRALVPRQCRVFEEDLLYLFYGSSFFRPPAGVTSDATQAPVSFVFHPAVVSEVARFYPFDTGAIASTLCGDAGRNLGDVRERYRLKGGGDAQVRRFVALAFGSNEAYLDGQLDPACRDRLREFPELYEFLAADLTQHGVDRRQCAIECQMQNPLVFGQSLLWVGFPECHYPLFEDLCDAIAPHVPRFHFYPVPRIVNPAELAAVLEAKAREQLSEYFMGRRHGATHG